MNNSDLERLLKTLPMPERSPEFWEQLPRRISAKAHWRGSRSTAPNPVPGSWRKAAWGISVATLCLLAAFGLWHRRGTEQANDLSRNERLVREVLGMFPNQIQAIVQDGSGLHLQVAHEPNIPGSTPLWIRICEAGRCRTIVTFSGQSVQIAGQRIEVLADARGEVMLVGEHFIWTGGMAAPERNLGIAAGPLKLAL